MHVRRGLQSALALLLVCLLAGAAAAGVWWLASGEYLRRYGLVLMVLATLIAISGGTELSRDATTQARALLGAGPDREVPGSGRHLTPVGVFLLVSLPLLVGGGLLVDAA